MEWFDAKTNPPTKDGLYLCLTVYEGFESQPVYNVRAYTNNLESVNEYAFSGETRPGWFNYDDEYGHYELRRVAYWMHLPKPPDELK